jgi:hypothetical protein
LRLELIKKYQSSKEAAPKMGLRPKTFILGKIGGVTIFATGAAASILNTQGTDHIVAIVFASIFFVFYVVPFLLFVAAVSVRDWGLSFIRHWEPEQVTWAEIAAVRRFWLFPWRVIIITLRNRSSLVRYIWTDESSHREVNLVRMIRERLSGGGAAGAHRHNPV